MSHNFRRSQDLRRSTSSEHESSGNYFEPNYPLHEPVFYIPRVPDLVKVLEPAPLQKPPAMGYDMKTLRKQVEFYNKELHDLTDNQSLLYTQNEQLWLYIQELLESNKLNAQIMKSEVLRISESLRSAQKEKIRIAQQLVMARNSKQVVAELNSELDKVKLDVANTEALKRDTEMELLKAETERVTLEDILQSDLYRMSSAASQLEDLKYQVREEESMDIAIKFFETNKCVLRSAYSRFRAAIRTFSRLRRLNVMLHKLHRKHLKQISIAMWRQYIVRCRMKHRNMKTRKREMMKLTMSRWKVYTALERLFKTTRRKHLLSHYLQEWCEYTKKSQYENDQLQLTDQFQHMQYMKKFFNAWKKTVVFLAWNHKETKEMEKVATLYFHKKLLSQWREIKNNSNNALYQKTRVVPSIFLNNRFKAWHSVCITRWKHRGRLMRRFFRTMEWKLKNNIEYKSLYGMGVANWNHFKKIKYLRVWQRRVKQLLYMKNYLFQFQTSPNTTQSPSAEKEGRVRSHSNEVSSFPTRKKKSDSAYELLRSVSRVHKVTLSTASPLLSPTGHKHVNAAQYNRLQLYKVQTLRLVRTSFLTIQYHVSVLRRQHLNDQIAMTSYLSNLASKYLSVWLRHVKQDVRRRLREQKRLYKIYFNGWLVFLLTQRQEELHRKRVQEFTERVVSNRHSTLIHRWFQQIRYDRHIRLSRDRLKNKLYFKKIRKVFIYLRNKFSHALYWRHKEVMLENKRRKSLQELSQIAADDLQRQAQQSLELTRSMEERVKELEALVAAKEVELQTKKIQVAAREKEKLSLTDTLTKTQQLLKDTENERERLERYEQVLQASTDKQQQERMARQREAELMLRKVQQEKEQLRSEVHDARQQSFLAEQMAEIEYQRDMQEYDRIMAKEEQLSSVVSNKRLHVSELEREHATLLADLTRVQDKLMDLNKSGEEVREENEAMLRSRLSEIRVLESQRGLAEARVRAKQEIVNDHKQRLSRMHISEVQADEERELNELLTLKAELENKERAYRSAHNMPPLLHHDNSELMQPPPPYYSSSSRPLTSRSVEASSRQATPRTSIDTMNIDVRASNDLELVKSKVSSPNHKRDSRLPRVPNSSKATSNNISRHGSEDEKDIFALTSPHTHQHQRSPQSQFTSSFMLSRSSQDIFDLLGNNTTNDVPSHHVPSQTYSAPNSETKAAAQSLMGLQQRRSLSNSPRSDYGDVYDFDPQQSHSGSYSPVITTTTTPSGLKKSDSFYLDAKHSAEKEYEKNKAEQSYHNTRQSIRELTDRLKRSGNGSAMQL